ncbi:glycine decarboxylase subunit P [Ascoidea rubescens DSM 1968]|uniref:Glycine cleavage system P protein n=1 Tax=Ascoidea rubescens DSM 1968 TaxID=1344418 RepID=A0A1D2VAC4_9ASCO|nr:glycine dehydrogenase [Ascoidea rubescens DSM 1968]ODV58604.1 glycine dehydrogenase [Ascoidea rubescens DSM 1968]
MLTSKIHCSIRNNAFSALAKRPLDNFQRRHLGPNPDQVSLMLKALNFNNLQSFIESVVPESILLRRNLNIHPQNGLTESQLLSSLKEIASKNKLLKSFIGKGYYNTITPPVILRNLFEAPEWYTSYTPYQPEISQGRLQSLLNYQTLVSDLTGLPIANASLLDEATAAAEAMIMSLHFLKNKKKSYVVDQNIHPQTLSVLKSRAQNLDINILQLDLTNPDSLASISSNDDICGALVQYPSTNGSIDNFSQISDIIHKKNGLFSVATDLLALTLLTPPSTFNADIALGSSQRFGVPMGYGGPHAAFFAVTQKLSRKMPGRLIGLSKDRLGNPALRLALQTREQHIKREKATSNICTAQALLANMAASYAVYHGPQGLKKIAERVFNYTSILANSIINSSDHQLVNQNWFDTLTIKLNNISSSDFLKISVEKFAINLFKVDESTVSLSLDESVVQNDLINLIELFTSQKSDINSLSQNFKKFNFYSDLTRNDEILSNPVFHDYHSETSMMRYLHLLQSKDISLANSMISLGSCTMKLNSAVEMIPVSWPEFSQVHPFAPIDQAEGYQQLIKELESDLANITGFDAVSLMPNSGAQGEYTGLRLIIEYLKKIGQGSRNICLIPVSAHGTNPASAAMAGLKVVPVKCLNDGSLDLVDLKQKAEKHSDSLAAVMITYPSTYGLFEPGVKTAIDIVHQNGGQVYLDGANMNAQVGLTSPGDLGADVCHLNLHKTFAIPHGGGGPGVGPVCVKKHLTPFLPSHPIIRSTENDQEAILPVSAATFGSASILPISYAYIKMMGATGLPYASIIAMLNANYMMHKLKDHYKIMFIGEGDIKHCGHEFIIDLRSYKPNGIEAIDVAKRLQDYGFHAPTMSFPVPGTLMIEPTESEDLAELDRFVDAMVSIKKEIDAKINNEPFGNVLKNSPHSLIDIISSPGWESRGYTREQAAFPLPYLKVSKQWPSVCRLDDTYGDMNLICSCSSVEEVANDN